MYIGTRPDFAPQLPNLCFANVMALILFPDISTYVISPVYSFVPAYALYVCIVCMYYMYVGMYAGV